MQQTTLKDFSIKTFIGLDGSKRVDILNVSESFADCVTSIKSNMNLPLSVIC